VRSFDRGRSLSFFSFLEAKKGRGEGKGGQKLCGRWVFFSRGFKGVEGTGRKKDRVGATRSERKRGGGGSGEDSCSWPGGEGKGGG